MLSQIRQTSCRITTKSPESSEWQPVRWSSEVANVRFSSQNVLRCFILMCPGKNNSASVIFHRCIVVNGSYTLKTDRLSFISKAHFSLTEIHSNLQWAIQNRQQHTAMMTITIHTHFTDIAWPQHNSRSRISCAYNMNNHYYSIATWLICFPLS